jgi:hypothetical protein
MTSAPQQTSDAPAAPPRRRVRRWLAAVGVLAIVGVMAALAYNFGSGYLWSRKFRAAVAGCDELRVRTGGLCHRHPEREAPVAQFTGVPEISRMTASLCTAFPSTSMQCRCCGDITLEFYAAGTLRAAVSVHHGETLRWLDHSGRDLQLSDEGQAAVRPWLARAAELRELALQAESGATPEDTDSRKKP